MLDRLLKPVRRQTDDRYARKVSNGIDAMLGYWDYQQRCRFANAAYLTWFGISPKDMRGIPIQSLLGQIYELNLPFIQAALEGNSQVFEREIHLPDGSIRYSIATYTPDIASRTVKGFTAHVADVTPMKRLEQEALAARKRSDLLLNCNFLTGSPNQFALTDEVYSAVSRAEATGQRLALTSVSLENLKEISRTYGPDAAEAMLKEIAGRLNKSVHFADTILRIGWNEFIIISAALDSFDSLHWSLHNLRRELSQPIRWNETQIPPMLCYGVALFPAHATNTVELIARVDQALCQSRKSGDGRIAFARS